jgi:hypothetical protein
LRFQKGPNFFKIFVINYSGFQKNIQILKKKHNKKQRKEKRGCTCFDGPRLIKELRILGCAARCSHRAGRQIAAPTRDPSMSIRVLTARHTPSAHSMGQPTLFSIFVFFSPFSFLLFLFYFLRF